MQISDSRKWAAFNLAVVGAYVGIGAEGKSKAEIEVEYGLITDPADFEDPLVEGWLEYVRTADFEVAKELLMEEWQLWLFVIPALVVGNKRELARFMVYSDDDAGYLEKMFEIVRSLREARKFDDTVFQGLEESDGVIEYVRNIKNAGYEDEMIEELYAYFDPYSIRGVFWRACASFMLSPEKPSASIIRVVNFGDTAVVAGALTGLMAGSFSGRLDIPASWKEFLQQKNVDRYYEELLENWAE